MAGRHEKITVLGFGSWGLAMALLLNGNGHDVRIWARSQEKIDEARRLGHSEYLPGVNIPAEIELTSDIGYAAAGRDIIVFAVPSRATADISAEIRPYLAPGAILVSAAKGFEPSSLRRLSEVIAENAPGCEVVAFLGPGYAEEVALSMTTAYVAACGNEEAAKRVQSAYMSDVFRVYTQSDVIGAEVGTALKNVIALASGILDGMGYGDNARAALITRGLSEISRLGEAMGGDRLTFSGLTGMGDLVLTCTSMRSRNRRCGILLGKGVPLGEALKEVHSVVEGVANAKPALELGRKYGVELPIVSEINECLFNGKQVRQTVIDLMGRDMKMEEQK